MIVQFIERFQEIKLELLEQFCQKEPESYEDIFKQTIKMMFPYNKDYDSESPDFERITVIDNGNYQGTLVFVVASQDYQPSDYWVSSIDYGSCSGCDTYQAYSTYGENPEESAQHMLTMALHMIESMKKIL